MLQTLTNPDFWAQFALQTFDHFVWIGTVVAIFWVAEHFWPAGPQPTILDRLNNFLILGAVSVLSALLNVAMSWAPNILVESGLSGVLIGDWRPITLIEVALATLLYLFCYDVLQYWFHRAQHAIPGLWFAHALHHDEERMNATTSMRNTMWHLVFGFFAVQIPLTILCGFNLLVSYAALIFFSTYGFFNHANIKLDLGPLGWIISGPQWHRLHHGRAPEYHNKNYAAFFPVIDMIFGTYLAPKRGENVVTGLADRPQRRLRPDKLVLDVAGL